MVSLLVFPPLVYPMIVTEMWMGSVIPAKKNSALKPDKPKADNIIGVLEIFLPYWIISIYEYEKSWELRNISSLLLRWPTKKGYSFQYVLLAFE